MRKVKYKNKEYQENIIGIVKDYRNINKVSIIMNNNNNNKMKIINNE